MPDTPPGPGPPGRARDGRYGRTGRMDREGVGQGMEAAAQVAGCHLRRSGVSSPLPFTFSMTLTCWSTSLFFFRAGHRLNSFGMTELCL